MKDNRGLQNGSGCKKENLWSIPVTSRPNRTCGTELSNLDRGWFVLHLQRLLCHLWYWYQGYESFNPQSILIFIHRSRHYLNKYLRLLMVKNVTCEFAVHLSLQLFFKIWVFVILNLICCCWFILAFSVFLGSVCQSDIDRKFLSLSFVGLLFGGRVGCSRP